MSRVSKGDIASSVVIQPDRSISEKNDGTLEGQVTYKCDKNSEFRLPQMGDQHPDNSKLECYNISKTYNSNGYLTATASFFGLTSSTTDPVVSYSGGQNNEPIETHPNFTTTVAGTYSAPINGAVFGSDPNTDDYRAFLGFLNEPAVGEQRLMGTEYYLTASTMITLSYWTDKVPSLKKRLNIYNKISGVTGSDFKVPDDVKDFLLLDTPYRQVGSFYQVTEQYLGSGVNGWSDLIYTRADA